jgi:hypothetical protein
MLLKSFFTKRRGNCCRVTLDDALKLFIFFVFTKENPILTEKLILMEDKKYPLELNTMPGFAGSSAYYLIVTIILNRAFCLD